MARSIACMRLMYAGSVWPFQKSFFSHAATFISTKRTTQNFLHKKSVQEEEKDIKEAYRNGRWIATESRLKK